jgi:hypothetical protein
MGWQDAFPDDDIVWGLFFLFDQFNFFKFAHFSLRRIGIAYTIDPVYEAEVRDYLGQTPFFHFYRAFLILVSIG